MVVVLLFSCGEIVCFDLCLCGLFGMMFVWLLWFGCCFGCVVAVYYS